MQARENSADPESVEVPNVKITGENYEVKGHKALLSTIIGYLRMACFAILFAGDQIFGMVGGVRTMPKAVQDMYQWINDNKFQFGLMVFFIGSMVQTNLMASGAFEIYVNGNLEYSKLETTQMPDYDAIQLIFRKYGVNV